MADRSKQRGKQTGKHAERARDLPRDHAPVEQPSKPEVKTRKDKAPASAVPRQD